MDISHILSVVDGYVWGLPLIVLLVGSGVFLTFRLGFVQIRHFGHAVGLVSGKYDDPSSQGDITHFQALSTALSATIGLGNIAGVAVAITMGGPGAVFWMWMTAIFGMASKFTSCTLALKYRTVHEDGSISGGPMYFIEQGLGKKFKWLAVFFACACISAGFGMGNMFQANQVASALNSSYNIPIALTGVVLAILAALVIIGGIKRIANVASKLVPLMCILYVLTAVVILIIKVDVLWSSLLLIVQSAFTGTAAFGGFAGAALSRTITKGVARGVFSNEAGLGSAPIAHAAAKTTEPVREGLVAMLGPFIDTIIICTMTALVIISTGMWHKIPGEMPGILITIEAFNSVLPGWGLHLVTIGAALFAFSTMIAWSYYGERCAEYLFGKKSLTAYRVVYIALIFVGSIFTLKPLIDFCDIANALMAIPTLIALIALSGTVAALTKDYFDRRDKGLIP